MSSIEQKVIKHLGEQVSLWRWTEQDERRINFALTNVGEKRIPIEFPLLHNAIKEINKATVVECATSECSWIRDCKKYLIQLENDCDY